VTCSFDGKDSITMGAGDILVICMSAWPLRAVCRTDTIVDWLTPLSRELYYNKRVVMKKDQ